MSSRTSFFGRALALFTIFTLTVGWSVFHWTQGHAAEAKEKSPSTETKGASEKKVPDFAREIVPIFKASCVRCHNEKRKRAELDLTTIAGILKGSESGPIIVPSDLKKSKLFEMVHGGFMPPSKELTKADIHLIERWIAAGAPGLKTENTTPEVTQLQIEPLMLLRCAICHGNRVQEAGLDVRTKASLLKGGKSGPAIVLGHPKKSLLLKRIHSGDMPPNKRLNEVSVKPIAPDEVELLEKWIELGAPEVEPVVDVATTQPDPLVTDKDRDFWAFQSPKKVDVPRVDVVGAKIRNPIDAFIARKMQAKKLTFSPEASRLTLIRRATFDLTGLPPDPAEVQAFLNDEDPNAYEKLIDRLLESPRYGERWGRYWLDLAGYADSEGKRSADPIRPHAWRYRDYVIRAFNSDKPYDRFLLEQLAGDELADYENADKMTPEMMDNLVATGFLRMTPDGTGSDVVNFVPDRLDVIADEIQVLGSSVMGLTLHCARCHSHKYDPIPQRDYYRLLAVFKGAYDEHDWLRPAMVPGQGRSKRPSRYLMNLSDEEQARWEIALKKINDEIEQIKSMKNPPRQIQQQLKNLEAMAKMKPAIRALWDRGQPSPAYLYRRGDYLQPAYLVGPGVPSVLTDGKTPFDVQPPFPGAKSTGRRLAFAKWLTRPDHPLTARVMVNRIWYHHFGQGIVKSLDNFGHTGTGASHPELLDWLARSFVDRGWSIKAMHRLMMTSTTYRQTSRVTDDLLKRDMENEYYTRMPLKRMEAEVVYDSLLLVTGKLDETRFGPPDAIVARKDGLVLAKPTDKGYRRSVYVRQRRTQIPTLLENFDLPQMNPNCVDRTDSTVASQALFLMNNKVVHELASSFARRITDDFGSEPARQIEGVFLTALSRQPTQEERQVSLEALAQLTRQWLTDLPKTNTAAEEEAARRALETYCHSILNSASFVYID